EHAGLALPLEFGRSFGPGICHTDGQRTAFDSVNSIGNPTLTRTLSGREVYRRGLLGRVQNESGFLLDFIVLVDGDFIVPEYEFPFLDVFWRRRLAFDLNLGHLPRTLNSIKVHHLLLAHHAVQVVKRQPGSDDDQATANHEQSPIIEKRVVAISEA